MARYDPWARRSNRSLIVWSGRRWTRLTRVWTSSRTRSARLHRLARGNAPGVRRRSGRERRDDGRSRRPSLTDIHARTLHAHHCELDDDATDRLQAIVREARREATKAG